MNTDLSRIGEATMGNLRINTIRMARAALADMVLNGKSVMWNGQRKFLPLDEMAKARGVEEQRTKHEALADTVVAAECYIKMRAKLEERVNSGSPKKRVAAKGLGS